MSTPDQVIGAYVAGVVFGKRYPEPLPDEIAPWYCYTGDGGHSIAIAVKSLVRGKVDPGKCVVPAPVKSVLRAGWTMQDGYVVCDLEYDSVVGLQIADGDDEFGDSIGEDGETAADGEQPAQFHALAVGQPYNPKVTSWPDGVAQLRVTPQGVEFLLSLARPRPYEVKAFGRGNAEFAIVPADRHLMWAYRFTDPFNSNAKNGISWSDTPWEYHREASAEPVAVPGGPGTSFALHLVLVDASTGLVQALRLVGPTVEFADALRAAVDRQRATPYNEAAASREVDAVYARYPHTTDLLLTAVARFEALRDGTTR